MTLAKKTRTPEKKLRVLVAKVGLDGHDRGVKIVARALRDAGIEVVYLGIHNTPAEIVMSALQEDVDAIGLSIHSAAHMTLFGAVMRLLKENKANDIVVFGGGIVPEEDIGKLKRMGVREIFTPGASLEAIVNFVQSIGTKRPKARRGKPKAIPSFAVSARIGGKSRDQAKQKSSASR